MNPNFQPPPDYTRREVEATLPGRLELLEPRLRPLFDVYVHSIELTERMLESVVLPGPAGDHLSDPEVNTGDFAALIKAAGDLSHLAAWMLIKAVKLRDSRPAAYEAFCKAVEPWAGDVKL